MKKNFLAFGAAIAASWTTAPGVNAASFTLNATDGACGAFGCTSSVAGAVNVDFNGGLPSPGFAQYP